MNTEQIEHMWKVASNNPNHDTNWHDPVVVAFAKLVAKHTLSNIDPSSFMSWQEGYEAGKQTEREACAELVWPKLKVWSEEEQTAMGLAFNKAQEKHGWYETLMAVGASVLKMKAEAIRARGQA